MHAATFPKYPSHTWSEALLLYSVLSLVDFGFQFKIATWFWQVALADEADNILLGLSPGLRIPPPW